jgi:hypothetical protein
MGFRWLRMNQYREVSMAISLLLVKAFGEFLITSSVPNSCSKC